MSNPYQSPETSPEPRTPHPSILGAIWSFLGGFLACVVVSYLAPVLPVFMVLLALPTSVAPSPQGCVLVASALGVILGPAFAVLVWVLSRECNRPLGFGAMTVGLVAFLVASSRVVMLVMFDS